MAYLRKRETITSQGVSDYEEGTWTPTCAVGSLASTSNTKYRKIGDIVILWASVTFDSSGGGTAQTIGGLPFSSNGVASAGVIGYTTFTAGPVTLVTYASGSIIYLYKQSTGAALDAAATASKQFDFSLTLRV